MSARCRRPSSPVPRGGCGYGTSVRWQLRTCAMATQGVAVGATAAATLGPRITGALALPQTAPVACGAAAPA